MWKVMGLVLAAAGCDPGVEIEVNIVGIDRTGDQARWLDDRVPVVGGSATLTTTFWSYGIGVAQDPIPITIVDVAGTVLHEGNYQVGTCRETGQISTVDREIVTYAAATIGGSFWNRIECHDGGRVIIGVP